MVFTFDRRTGFNKHAQGAGASLAGAVLVWLWITMGSVTIYGSRLTLRSEKRTLATYTFPLRVGVPC